MKTVAEAKYHNAEFEKARKTAESRLYPSIFSAAHLELRARRIRMERFFVQRENWGKVLDVGAQYCPYFPMFQDRCESYTSLDVVDTPLVDIVCDAEHMDIEDSTYDLVLCTQVLEHTRNPQQIVNECLRVLKPGGMLIVTVPSIFPEHGYPADNWRFMPNGLRVMLSGFSSVQVFGEMGFAESWAATNCHFVHVLTRQMGPVGRVLDPIIHLLSNVFARTLSTALRPFTKHTFLEFSMNLWAEARK